MFAAKKKISKAQSTTCMVTDEEGPCSRGSEIIPLCPPWTQALPAETSCGVSTGIREEETQKGVH